ncbi:MAG: zinc-binding dehydrogenase, partial [Planctomycetota bacterium]
MKARAIACTGPQRTEVIDIELPDTPAPGEVLVAKRYCSASPGTDLRCIRLAQPGGARLPFVMGYSSVGVVEAVGDGVDMAVGTPVFCMGTRHLQEHSSWGAYTSHGLHGADEVVPVPTGVDLRYAALTKIAAISYHGLRLAQPLPHERVAVVGLGIIGQLAARLYHLAGAHVVAADPQARRQELARAVGIGIAKDPAAGLQQAFAAHFPDGADLVVDATGHPTVLAESVNLARDLPWDESFTPAPRLLMQGSYVAEAPM